MFFFGQRGNTTGFTATAVERDTPVLNNDGTFDSFSKDPCFKYSQSRPGGRHGDWALLQKFPETEVLPNGFIVEAAKISPPLLEALKPLALQFGDDYYEFERVGDIVSVFVSCKASNADLEKFATAIIALDA